MKFIINFKIQYNIYGHLKGVTIQMNIGNKEFWVLKIFILKSLKLYSIIMKYKTNIKINTKYTNKIKKILKIMNKKMN